MGGRTFCTGSAVAGRDRALRWLVAALFGALTAWCLLAVLWPLAEPGAYAHLRAFGYAGAAAVLVAAGAMQLARARLTADPLLRWSGAAMLVLGAGILLAGVLGSLAISASDGRQAPLTRLLIVAPALAMLLVGTGPHATRTGHAALRLAAVLIVAHAGIGLVLSAPRVTDWVAHERFDALWLAEALFTAALWTLIALRLITRVRRSHTELARYLGWRAAALTLMAASELLYSAGLAGARVASTIAAGFVFVAAAIMLTVAAVGLREAFAATSLRTLQLADELRDTRVRLQLVEERQRERLHDARTALVGVVGATRVYAKPSDGGPDRSTDLQRIVAAEMHRLSSLLDLDAEEPAREFALADAFEPVLLAHRALGMRLHADVDGLRVYGRPTVTATVLANVLTNAATHAPGATVLVRAASAGTTVRISVEDDGPGIPAEERELVLRRGVRSSTARTPGSGLGLYSAAQAMAGQGGSLRVESRSDGASGTRIVLGLPAAAGALPLAPLRAKAS